MEAKQKDRRCLRDAISTEFNLIKTSETIGGALTHLGVLIAKVRRQPHIDCIIASAETGLAEEDRIAFENLEKAVAWFHEKIRILLPHVKWAPDSFAMADVNALLNFHTLSLNANGYAGSLLFQLRHLYSEVAKEEKNCLLFEGWIRTEKSVVALWRFLIGPIMWTRALTHFLPINSCANGKKRRILLYRAYFDF